jgi:beta-ureidopropionase
MKIGLVQMTARPEPRENLDKAAKLVAEAASKGAQIACLQELFNTVYVGFEQNPKYFDWAEEIPGPATERMSQVARDNHIAVIAPIFEKDTEVPGLFYNSAAVIDSSGKMVGKYRKASLPQLPEYEEKFYFRPGNLGYPVIDMKDVGAKVGLVICYDRHFLEGPRILALKGAEVVFIPTCTGYYPELWELELRAHAAFNTVFVAGVNRCGVEFPGQKAPYYGKSMVVDPSGNVAARAGEKEEVLVADIDLDKIQERRRLAPFLRDRRPDSYKEIASFL